MENDMQLYCIARPQDLYETEKDGVIPVCRAYRAGKGGLLLSLPLGIALRGGLMGIDDAGLDPDGFDGENFAYRVSAECVLRGFDGVYADVGDAFLHTGTLTALENRIIQRRGRLYLCENAARGLSSARIVISSCVTGGSFARYLADKIYEYGAGRIALGINRMITDFTLPASDALGMNISEETLGRLLSQSGASVYFSNELCANYFTYVDKNGTPHFTLFEDRRSLLEKMRIARDSGIEEAFVDCSELPLVAPQIS